MEKKKERARETARGISQQIRIATSLTQRIRTMSRVVSRRRLKDGDIRIRQAGRSKVERREKTESKEKPFMLSQESERDSKSNVARETHTQRREHHLEIATQGGGKQKEKEK